MFSRESCNAKLTPTDIYRLQISSALIILLKAIPFSEFLKFLRVPSFLPTLHEHLQLDFDRLDADGDGLISQEELANAMAGPRPAAGALREAGRGIEWIK